MKVQYENHITYRSGSKSFIITLKDYQFICELEMKCSFYKVSHLLLKAIIANDYKSLFSNDLI